RGGVGVGGEQRWRDLVHALVCALSREDRGHEELERRAEVERALRVRVELAELLEDRAHAHRIGGDEALARALRGARGLLSRGARPRSRLPPRRRRAPRSLRTPVPRGARVPRPGGRVLRPRGGGPGTPRRRAHAWLLRQLRTRATSARAWGTSRHGARERNGGSPRWPAPGPRDHADGIEPCRKPP